jgi:hypothetical protein
MREFSQLVPYHVLRYSHWDVVLPVVHEKSDPACNAKMFETRTPSLNDESNTYPTKFGRIVQERASVLMGVLFASASRMLGNATKNGPARQLVAMNYILSLRG